MLDDSELQALLAARRPAHSLPRPFYTDPEVFAADMEKIW